MIKTDQTDYAAAYRQYCTYGRGRTLKKFCGDEDYNYTKLRRYIDQAHISISFVQVQLSNGLNLRVEAPAIDSLVDVLHKLVS